MKKCKNCDKLNPDDAKFCVSCGALLEETETVDAYEIPKQEKVKPNKLNIVSRVFAIIAAIITLFAYSTIIAMVGLTISVISILILAIGYLKGAMVGKLRANLFLNIYSFVANFVWLAYSLWIAPAL